MSWIPRIAIPSYTGSYVRILSTDADVTKLKRYGDENYETILVAVVAWSSLLGDSPLEHKPNKVINSFVNTLLNDYAGTCARYADLSDALSRSVEHTEDGQGLITGAYIDGFRDTPVFREYLEFHRLRDPLLLRYLMTFLNYGRKVGYVDENLNRKALRLWFEVEERLENAQMPCFVDSLRAIVHWMFSKGWVEGPFLPKHGGGAVAERDIWGAVGKNWNMRIDPKLSYMYEREDPDSLTIPTPDGSYILPRKDVGLSTARLRFVPKDLKKTRSICMEPTDFMWAQQGVRLWYERWLEDGPLSAHVHLKDQSFNQILCWHGSITSELATIDLSSASDSVSLKLVKSLFPPEVLKHLLSTRSRNVEVPGYAEPIRVNKFAPMGSALCFPVQCTIFSAIVLMVSIAQSYGRDIWNGETIVDLDLDYAYWVTQGISPQYRHYHRFFVYGDDIICDQQVVSNVVRSLEALCFQVNTDKSYVGPVAYRESCGKHYFNGFDTTPLTLKAKTLNPRMSVDAFVGLVDATNLAADSGYLSLYSALVNVCLHRPIEGVKQNGGKNPVLFVPLDSSESCAIRTRYPNNKHLKRRFFDSNAVVPDPRSKSFKRKQWTHLLWQRDEIQSISVGPEERKRSSRKHDNYYHVLWWRTRYSERFGDKKKLTDEESVLAKADTKGVCVRWRWTAV